LKVANPIGTRRYAPHTPRNPERMRDDYIDALRRLAAPDYTLCTQVDRVATPNIFGRRAARVVRSN